MGKPSQDLAVGYFPDLKRSNFFRQRLFTHYFVCLLRRDHPVRTRRLSLDQFSGLGHAIVRAEGRSQELFERFLESKHIHRRGVLFTTHFMSLPFILEPTDPVAVVPHAVGLAFAGRHTRLRTVELPMALPRFDLKQHWHRKFHGDAKNKWLRALVAELFNDAADEWK